MRPRLLDLFACEGVGGSGYEAAGFDVFAVDIDQDALSRNPYPSHCGDALEFLAEHGSEFDVIHASPPCQARTTMSNKHRGKGTRADSWPELIEPTRDLLIASGKPWVLENVTGARSDMLSPFLLHGGMFGLGVYRPRLFDSNMLIPTYDALRPLNPVAVYGKLDGALVWRRADGTEQRRPKTVEAARVAMDGPAWASWRGLCEAIPPAYTRYIGGFLLANPFAVPERIRAARCLEGVTQL